jgi:hypothetical protein
MRKPWFITLKFLPYSGMAVFPFVLIKHTDFKWSKTLVYHERIHLMQQLELLILPFYFFYVFNYCVNLVRFRNHDRAYREIIFEKEAYQNEKEINYLRKRPFWAFLRYL